MLKLLGIRLNPAVGAVIGILAIGGGAYLGRGLLIVAGVVMLLVSIFKGFAGHMGGPSQGSNDKRTRRR